MPRVCVCPVYVLPFALLSLSLCTSYLVFGDRNTRVQIVCVCMPVSRLHPAHFCMDWFDLSTNDTQTARTHVVHSDDGLLLLALCATDVVTDQS